MSSTTTQAPTSVDAAALAIRIQGKLEETKELLQQASEDADALIDLVSDCTFLRFHNAVAREVDWLADYLGPNQASSVFDVDDALKNVGELLELMSYADRKDD